MKALGIITWIYIATLITSIIQAEVIHKLWAWFAARELGAGPSVGAWFGIATILGLIVRHATGWGVENSGKQKTPVGDALKQSVTQYGGGWLGCAVLLVMAWAVGATFGWLGP